MIWKLFEIFLKFLPTIHDFQKLRALARTNSHSREYELWSKGSMIPIYKI